MPGLLFLKVLNRHFLDLLECFVLPGGGRLATLVRGVFEPDHPRHTAFVST